MKRRLIVAAVAALVAVAFLAPTTAEAAVNPGPASASPCSEFVWAIDVSRWQGTIDWNAVRDRGVAGAWIKVGGTEGYNYTDPAAATNKAGAGAAGLPWGTYSYNRPTRGGGAAQADYAVSIGLGHGILPPTLDIEENPYGLSGYELDTFVLDFMHEVTRLTGRVGLVYTGAYLGVGYSGLDLSAYGLWIANYPRQVEWSNPCQLNWPPVPNAWGSTGFTVWQHNSVTHIPGIPQNSTDQNIVTPQAWAQWTGGSVVQNPAGDPVAADQTVWQQGSRGPAVARIQRIVGVPDDAEFGPATKAAVIRWQRALGVTADGVWGPGTEAATAGFFDWLAGQNLRAPVYYHDGPDQNICDLQSLLADNGYDFDGARYTCRDDDYTNNIVGDYQATHGLDRTYVVDSFTWATLGQAGR